MPIRDFMSDDGVAWRVWSTAPTAAHDTAIHLEAWLTFESNGVRRRLTPIPDGWECASTSLLASLCERAVLADELPEAAVTRLVRAWRTG